MGDFFTRLFSNDFMPHKMCFLGDPAVQWLHVTSDLTIALAYYLIPILLVRFARRRSDMGFRWIFVAFAWFIVACGTSHLMGAITVFNPVYRLEGVVKAMTAVASVATFALLIPAMPALIALPSPSALASANRKLELQIEERRNAEATVRSLNEELELRVAARTSDLEQALHDLRGEMHQRQELQKQLVQSQKLEAVGRLAGGVAHDFNNLLTVIMGYSEMLRGQYDGEPVREIAQAAERAAALTKQLLAFGRRQVAAVQVVDVNEAVRRTEKMLSRVIGEDVELVLKMEPRTATVEIDPSQIDQILLNLAVNARDAMPNGGTLSIETAAVQLDEQYASVHAGIRPGPHVMISVGDTGSGMDEETTARIFEPFFTTKEPGKGTGLGLSIVYGIVKQNGGEILVYSEPGHGTTFKMFLPAASEGMASPAPEPKQAQHTLTAKTILLVEDNAQVRGLAQSMLDQMGCRVHACASPDEALAVVSDQGADIDLLITDVVMPRMRGPELAALVCSKCPQAKVLFMSGYNESGLENQGVLRSNVVVLRKPFVARDLRAKIDEALHGTVEENGSSEPGLGKLGQSPNP